MPGWLREPLLHFVLAGGLLFAIDAAIEARTVDPNEIVLTAGVEAELRKIHVDEAGREPTAAEMKAMQRRWFDNELLYREGLSMGLDRGDSGIRDRVIFKALSVVDAGLQRPKADEATLRAWFAQHQERYNEPPRVDLFEAVMPGQPDAAAVAAFAQALNDGKADTSTSGLRVFRSRPLASIKQAFGEDFANQLADVPLKQWQAMQTAQGPRAMMVEVRHAGQTVRFEDVSDTVQKDWFDQRMAELRTDAVRALTEKYSLRVASEVAK
jgi:hypothetical protein